MIFKSRQVNLDPKPFVNHYDHSDRSSQGDDLPGGLRTYRPRPEFEPTRDPQPWAHRAYGDRSEFDLNSYVWAPRREQFDTPLSRVLVDIRGYRGLRKGMNNPKGWAHVLRRFKAAAPSNPWGATTLEIDHAHRVLTRLAQLEMIS